MKALLFAATLAFLVSQESPQPDLPSLIAQTRTFGIEAGEALWPGYGVAPFEMLLIDGDTETLFCPASARADFVPAGIDEATGCERMTRARSTLPDTLLAALPIFGPPSTIVMGTPARTGKTQAGWAITILHEHFHQWQASQPDYYARVAALDLAGDDKTGMWMLNFPFPYGDATVGARYRAATTALSDALAARGGESFRAKAHAYLKARRGLAAAAGERNWRYLDFQLWQEGVARWTEIALGRRHADPAIRQAADDAAAAVLSQLKTGDLASRKRLVAYSLGAAEAMLADACDPDWRSRYLDAMGMTATVERAIGRCDA